MPKARVNGINLYYETYGSGFPVVLSHGFAGTSRSWDPQIQPMSRRHKFIIYDIRGHGQSTSPLAQDKYSMDEVVEDLYRLLRYLKVEQAVVGGLSFGGYLSLKFFAAHKDMVKSLILCGTGPGYRNPERMKEWDDQRLEVAKDIETKGIQAFADSAYARNLSYTKRDVMLKHNPRGLAGINRGAMLHPQGIDILPTVNVPTLIVCGDGDTPFLGATDYMVQRIPGAQKVIIAKAGHGCNVDQPAVFNKAVLDFLGKIGV